MAGKTLPMHYVCTLGEARQIVEAHQEYWVANCGCREGRGACARSRIDLCLMFGDLPASGSGKRQINRAAVEEILREAADRRLVARPFRDDKRSTTDGICFCCDDCCGYFLDPTEECDKGALVEETAFESCTHCGVCVDVCHFGAREMAADMLTLDREKCYGCGLCVDVCPEGCVAMTVREA